MKDSLFCAGLRDARVEDLDKIIELVIEGNGIINYSVYLDYRKSICVILTLVKAEVQLTIVIFVNLIYSKTIINRFLVSSIKNKTKSLAINQISRTKGGQHRELTVFRFVGLLNYPHQKVSKKHVKKDMNKKESRVSFIKWSLAHEINQLSSDFI